MCEVESRPKAEVKGLPDILGVIVICQFVLLKFTGLLK